MNGSHTASDGELWVEVFYTTEPSIGSDRSFMLTAVGITAVMTQSGSHYTVLVPAAEAARARVELHRYNIESAPAPAQTRG